MPAQRHEHALPFALSPGDRCQAPDEMSSYIFCTAYDIEKYSNHMRWHGQFPPCATNTGSHSYKAAILSVCGDAEAAIELASLTPVDKMLSNSLCVCIRVFPRQVYTLEGANRFMLLCTRSMNQNRRSPDANQRD